jgi:hypothetical protein
VYQSPLGLWPTAAILYFIFIHQITFYHWNNPVEICQGTWILKNPDWKISLVPGIEPVLQLPIMTLMHILLNSIDTDKK